MSKYSRMKKPNTKRSKSADLSDLSFPHEIHKAISSYEYDHNKTRNNCVKFEENPGPRDLIEDHEQEDGDGETFGVILSRRRLMSSDSISSCKFMAGKQSTSLQGMVKRTFSIKRSFSVSRGYSRIGDGDGVPGLSAMQSGQSKKKGRIFKACRSLLGL